MQLNLDPGFPSHMVTKNAMFAIATAIVAVAAFGLIAPVSQAMAATSSKLSATTPTPIPQAASCTYTGHPTNPLSQTTVAIGTVTLTKQAEKELYNCVASGFPGVHYVLDSTLYTNIRSDFIETAGVTHPPSLAAFSFSNVICAKDAAPVAFSPVKSDGIVGFSGLVYSCETLPVGDNVVPATNCAQMALASPQNMETVVVNGVAKTVESQKELFRCTTTHGPIIQEVVIWTNLADYQAGATGVNDSLYFVETCQKPVTTTELASLPIINCASTAPLPLVT